MELRLPVGETEQRLCCPGCGGDNLHPLQAGMADDSVVVFFWCESCPEGTKHALNIYHHKGWTHVYWEEA